MDKQEVEYIAGLEVKKHESKFHKKPRAKQDENRYDEQFEYFWQRFPGRWNVDKGGYDKVGKYEAWLVWKTLKLDEKRNAAAVADKVTGKYVPDACRWLKRKMFDDFKLPKEPK